MITAKSDSNHGNVVAAVVPSDKSPPSQKQTGQQRAVTQPSASAASPLATNNELLQNTHTQTSSGLNASMTPYQDLPSTPRRLTAGNADLELAGVIEDHNQKRDMAYSPMTQKRPSNTQVGEFKAEDPSLQEENLPKDKRKVLFNDQNLEMLSTETKTLSPTRFKAAQRGTSPPKKLVPPVKTELITVYKNVMSTAAGHKKTLVARSSRDGPIEDNNLNDMASIAQNEQRKAIERRKKQGPVPREALQQRMFQVPIENQKKGQAATKEPLEKIFGGGKADRLKAKGIIPAATQQWRTYSPSQMEGDINLTTEQLFKAYEQKLTPKLVIQNELSDHHSTTREMTQKHFEAIKNETERPIAHLKMNMKFINDPAFASQEDHQPQTATGGKRPRQFEMLINLHQDRSFRNSQEKEYTLRSNQPAPGATGTSRKRVPTLRETMSHGTEELITPHAMGHSSHIHIESSKSPLRIGDPASPIKNERFAPIYSQGYKQQEGELLSQGSFEEEAERVQSNLSASKHLGTSLQVRESLREASQDSAQSRKSSQRRTVNSKGPSRFSQLKTNRHESRIKEHVNDSQSDRKSSIQTGREEKASSDGGGASSSLRHTKGPQKITAKVRTIDEVHLVSGVTSGARQGQDTLLANTPSLSASQPRSTLISPHQNTTLDQDPQGDQMAEGQDTKSDVNIVGREGAIGDGNGLDRQEEGDSNCRRSERRPKAQQNPSNTTSYGKLINSTMMHVGNGRGADQQVLKEADSTACVVIQQDQSTSERQKEFEIDSKAEGSTTLRNIQSNTVSSQDSGQGAPNSQDLNGLFTWVPYQQQEGTMLDKQHTSSPTYSPKPNQGHAHKHQQIVFPNRQSNSPRQKQRMPLRGSSIRQFGNGERRGADAQAFVQVSPRVFNQQIMTAEQAQHPNIQEAAHTTQAFSIPATREANAGFQTQRNVRTQSRREQLKKMAGLHNNKADHVKEKSTPAKACKRSLVVEVNAPIVVADRGKVKGRKRTSEVVAGLVRRRTLFERVQPQSSLLEPASPMMPDIASQVERIAPRLVSLDNHPFVKTQGTQELQHSYQKVLSGGKKAPLNALDIKKKSALSNTAAGEMRVEHLSPSMLSDESPLIHHLAKSRDKPLADSLKAVSQVQEQDELLRNLVASSLIPASNPQPHNQAVWSRLDPVNSNQSMIHSLISRHPGVTLAQGMINVQPQHSASIHQSSHIDGESSYQTARLTPMELKLPTHSQPSTSQYNRKVHQAPAQGHQSEKRPRERQKSKPKLQLGPAFKSTREVSKAASQTSESEAHRQHQQQSQMTVQIKSSSRKKETASKLSGPSPCDSQNMNQSQSPTPQTAQLQTTKKAFLRQVYTNMQSKKQGGVSGQFGTVERRSVNVNQYTKRVKVDNEWQFRLMKSKLQAFEDDQNNSQVLKNQLKTVGQSGGAWSRFDDQLRQLGAADPSLMAASGQPWNATERQSMPTSSPLHKSSLKLQSLHIEASGTIENSFPMSTMTQNMAPSLTNDQGTLLSDQSIVSAREIGADSLFITRPTIDNTNVAHAEDAEALGSCVSFQPVGNKPAIGSGGLGIDQAATQDVLNQEKAKQIIVTSPGSNAYLSAVRKKLKSQGQGATRRPSQHRNFFASPQQSFSSTLDKSKQISMAVPQGPRLSDEAFQGSHFDALNTWTNRSHLRTGGNQRHKVLRMDYTKQKEHEDGDKLLSTQTEQEVIVQPVVSPGNTSMGGFFSARNNTLSQTANGAISLQPSTIHSPRHSVISHMTGATGNGLEKHLKTTDYKRQLIQRKEQRKSYAISQAKPSLFQPIQMDTFKVDSIAQAQAVTNQILKPGQSYQTTQSLATLNSRVLGNSSQISNQAKHSRMTTQKRLSHVISSPVAPSHRSVMSPVQCQREGEDLARTFNSAYMHNREVCQQNSNLRRKAFSFTKSVKRSDIKQIAKNLNTLGKTTGDHFVVSEKPLDQGEVASK